MLIIIYKLYIIYNTYVVVVKGSGYVSFMYRGREMVRAYNSEPPSDIFKYNISNYKSHWK
jgi:hypothetical protein